MTSIPFPSWNNPILKFLCIGFFCWLLAGCAIKEETLPPTPESFILAIDVGHTKAAPGALSARGAAEYDFNKNLSLQLLNRLKSMGYHSAFIINPSGGPVRLADRTQMAAKKGAALFISIHHDSVQPHYLKGWEWQGKPRHYCDQFHGYSLFVSATHVPHAQSRAFADILGVRLLRSGFSPSLHHAEPIQGENRAVLDSATGVYRFDELAVLKSATMPAILVECGVLVHRDEEVLLSNAVYQKAWVRALADAVDAFRLQMK